jgi:hypothetical protein
MWLSQAMADLAAPNSPCSVERTKLGCSTANPQTPDIFS